MKTFSVVKCYSNTKVSSNKLIKNLHHREKTLYYSLFFQDTIFSFNFIGWVCFALKLFVKIMIEGNFIWLKNIVHNLSEFSSQMKPFDFGWAFFRQKYFSWFILFVIFFSTIFWRKNNFEENVLTLNFLTNKFKDEIFVIFGEIISYNS